MKTTGFILFLASFILFSFSSPEGVRGNLHKEKIKAHALKLSQAFSKKDYNAIADYTYPKVLELMGGKAAMIQGLEAADKEMAAQGVKLISVTIGEPSDIYETDKELQCTLPQSILLKVPGGKVESVSTLIAVSSDEGKSWSFIDTSGNDIQSVRTMLPNVSAEIPLPPKKEPLFTPEK